MTTFGDLVSETLLQLDGFGGDITVVGTLVTGLAPGDTTISVTPAVADGAGFSTGVWEINDELIYVSTYNRSTGVASNVIRGWRGTTAGTHTTGSTVFSNPKFPVVQVKKAINDTIRSLFPKVPAVKVSDFSLAPSQYRYQLPADCKSVINVSMKNVYETFEWVPMHHWKFIPKPGGTLDGFTAIEIGDPQAYDVRVVYAAEPTTLAANADDFETVTGLPSFVRETVIWGAMWRLFSMSELGRAPIHAADQALLNQQSPVGKVTDLAKYLLAMFQQSLSEAEARFQDLYPAEKHYTW